MYANLNKYFLFQILTEDVHYVKHGTKFISRDTFLEKWRKLHAVLL